MAWICLTESFNTYFNVKPTSTTNHKYNIKCNSSVENEPAELDIKHTHKVTVVMNDLTGTHTHTQSLIHTNNNKELFLRSHKSLVRFAIANTWTLNSRSLPE